ncbi:endonuclease/exonuclease/phosphatase family protein [Tardiphaga sp. 841_E9_N1_2]|jgi:hypothetical protein|uniref:endonuclease/exonuclease/phosphatase family protein n=1 Tax=Tardiphaga sp. 841_E9_N1_2 TaxID=3240762 RepID=UPI003F2771B0
MVCLAFWNVKGTNAAPVISELCAENAIDILFLAENSIDIPKLLRELNRNAPQTYISPFNPSSKISILTRYPLDSLTLVSDDAGIAIRHLKPPIGIPLLLVAVHLPSKLHRSDAEQTIHALRIASAIRAAEMQTGNANSVVMGDFNMNPFEDGMVAADGLHAVMDQTLARSLDRVVDGTARSFFYNPMWSRLGDESEGPPGTYFKRGGQISLFWHTFDQILLRPSLLDYYSKSDLRVVTRIGDLDLLKGSQINTSISDHLPILISLAVERGTIS